MPNIEDADMILFQAEVGKVGNKKNLKVIKGDKEAINIKKEDIFEPNASLRNDGIALTYISKLSLGEVPPGSRIKTEIKYIFVIPVMSVN